MALPRKSVPTITIERQIVDRIAYAAGTWKPTPPPTDRLSLLQHHTSFANLTGPSPASILLERQPSAPLYSRACIYLPSPFDELFITSNLLTRTDSSGKTILISHLTFHRNENGGIASRTYEKFYPTGNSGMANPSGGAVSMDGVFWCSQGDMGAGVAGLFYIPHGSREARPILTNFGGKPFNSLYDAFLGRDNAFWFTDRRYEEMRPSSVIAPDGVYRFDPDSGVVRLVAEGFEGVRGLVGFGEVVYVVDAGELVGGGGVIYAFDIHIHSGQQFLVNKRVFAMLDTGPPATIKCDPHGNVYVGCGDGVHVFDSGGVLIGKILVPGGVGGFCFGREGEMFLCNETKLWRVQMDGGLEGDI